MSELIEDLCLVNDILGCEHLLTIGPRSVVEVVVDELALERNNNSNCDLRRSERLGGDRGGTKCGVQMT